MTISPHCLLFFSIIDNWNAHCIFYLLFSVHRVPYVAVSIGLAVNKQAVMGVVYAPMTDDLFTAITHHVLFSIAFFFFQSFSRQSDIASKGAYVNGKRMHVSRIEKMEHALMVPADGFILFNIDFFFKQH